ncbi:MAG: hypothetical protein JSW43_01290 [Gemmatimonadota bacterium]|nr:MAG: hypothetical protein JSW43_01290 [Gemmatimonadota bacterium]
MIRRVIVAGALLIALTPATLPAQEHPLVRRAQQAYDALDFTGAIRNASAALQQRLTRADRILAYELLGFTYGALDSTRQAVEAFRQLIFLDPDREPDVERVSPRITSLYASALGQVLVVRRLTVDSTSIIAGQGFVRVRFEVTRAARAVTRVVGGGLDLVIDSTLVVAGETQVLWDPVTVSGDPLAPGTYQVVVTAFEGSNQFGAPLDLTLSHSSVDTLAHLTSLPGYTEQPEYETPGRSWQPLGVVLLSTGLAAGAAVALENPNLEIGERKELAGVSLLTLIAGVALSLKKPDPVPVEANILYNQLLREELARRNADIARQNQERRRQVMLTVTPLEGAP